MAKKGKKLKARKASGRKPSLPKKGKQVKKIPVRKRKTKKKTRIGFSTNNFNFIRSLLWSRHREDFKSYFDASFIQAVRELYNDCKQAGIDCTEEVVLRKYEQLKKDNKRPQPFILPSFLSPKSYWEIKDYPFPTTEPYLYVVSTMILPYPHEFRITEYFRKVTNEKGITTLDIFGYNKFFADWVNWCNAAMRGEHGLEYGSDEVEIYFKFTEPAYNEIKQRWETNIYTCTPSGMIYDFGYKPDEFTKDTDVESELRLPKDKEIIKEPESEEEERKKQYLKRKNKKRDTLNALNDLAEELRKLRLENAKEKYDKEMAYYSQVQDDLEKEIKKAKRRKDTKKVKELEKMYSKVGDKKIKIIKDFGKILGF